MEAGVYLLMHCSLRAAFKAGDNFIWLERAPSMHHLPGCPHAGAKRTSKGAAKSVR